MSITALKVWYFLGRAKTWVKDLEVEPQQRIFKEMLRRNHTADTVLSAIHKVHPHKLMLLVITFGSVRQRYCFKDNSYSVDQEITRIVKDLKLNYLVLKNFVFWDRGIQTSFANTFYFGCIFISCHEVRLGIASSFLPLVFFCQNVVCFPIHATYPANLTLPHLTTTTIYYDTLGRF